MIERIKHELHEENLLTFPPHCGREQKGGEIIKTDRNGFNPFFSP